MKSKDFIKEDVSNIADDAMSMHKDHEVQMAREECYHIASNAIQLHRLLKTIDENVGIDAWAASKISLANDYVRTVKEWLEYELMDGKYEQFGNFDSPMMMGESDSSSTGSSSIAVSMAVPAGKKKKPLKRAKDV